MSSDKVEGKIQELAGRAESGIGDAIGDTQASVSGRIREGRGVARETLGQVKDQLGEKAGQVASVAHDVFDNRDRHIEQGKRTIEAQVSENPLLALTFAALVGLLIGMLLGRNRR